LGAVMDLNTFIGTVGAGLTSDHILRAMEYCESGGMNNYDSVTSKGLIIERDQLQLGLDAALGRGDDLMLELDDARNEIARLKLERDALFAALREADGR